MPPTLVRHRRATSVLVLSLLLVLMSLPAMPNHFLNLIFPTARAATSFTVNSTGDGVDSNLVDGVCNDGTGACTLRAAIQQANAAGGDAINFSLPSASKIILTGGELLIDKGLSINGQNVVTVSGNNASRVMRVTGAPVFLSFLNVTEGRSTGGGGIFNDGGDLTIVWCTISGNNATTGFGGGISNGTGEQQSGLLSIHGSTISNNRADGGGGGIFQIATAFLTDTTISNNSTSGSGGGISNANPTRLTDVTITGNSATNSGGGIYNPGIGALTFLNTLIAGNTSPTGPDCMGANFVSLDYNLIGNPSGAQITGFTAHNITNVNPLLGPLAENSGLTFTHALLVGSPAIDAGNSPFTNDQRPQPRPIDDITVPNATGGNASDIGAYEAHTFQVTSTADSTDGTCTAGTIGNGCTLREAITASNAEPGSELITFAPALTAGGPATIEILTPLPNLAGDMTIAGPGASSLSVQRSSAGGTPRFRIFTILGGAITVNISGLTISNGHTADGTDTVNGVDGGGVLNGFNETLNLTDVAISGNATGNGSLGGYGAGIFSSGTLRLSNTTISGNQTGDGIGPSGVGGQGGGIYDSGTLTITNSTISGNSTGNGLLGGGSAAGISSSVALTILNSTISGNTTGVGPAGGGGGGIWCAGTLTLSNSTISGNHANFFGGGLLTFSTATLTNVTITGNRVANDGGGLFHESGNLTLRNTVVSGNFLGASPSTTPDDISGTVNAAASSFNLIGTGGSGGLSNGTNNNQVGVEDPKLAPLANYGGPNLTHALLTGSPAVDAGGNANLPPDTFDLDGDGNTSEAIPFDQRGTGFNRSMDGNGDGAATVDIGAYEVQSILVTNTADSGAGSLRQAITDANSNSGSDAINFQPGLTGTIILLTELPWLSTSVSINGPGANLIAVARSSVPGTPQFRIFTISEPVSVHLKGLTISNGFADNGGGIFNFFSATLTLMNCAVTDNTSDFGGGLRNEGNLTIVGSTIAGNTANPFAGGGMINRGSGASATIINSTFSGNQAGAGGGIFDDGITTTLTLTNCTITGNTATNGGSANGLHTNNFPNQTPENAKVRNTIIAGNTGAGPELNGFFTSQGHNLIGASDGSNGFINGNNGDQVGTASTPLNARLGPLVINDGPTMTHSLLAGSPALDAGDDSVIGAPLNLSTDQRGTGFSRQVDGPDANTTATVDIGAFEAQISLEDISDRSTNEDAQLQFTFNVGGSASITDVIVSSSNTSLVPNNAANIAVSGSGSTRTLTINPSANQFGTSTITVIVNVNLSQTMSDTFLLTVNPVNDAPSFTKGPDQTVNENDGAQTVNSWATNISTGPANESGQTLTFTVASNSNPALFLVAPVISPTGVLTYTPASGASGTAIITIALMDDGGTANGGINTSATQTFNINVREGGTLAFSAATYSVAEGAGNGAITITRSGGSAGIATVLFATSNGSATAGDYTSVSQTITFNDGEVSKTVNVAITDDLFREPNETINLTLSNAGGSGQLGVQTTALLTIIDDDPSGGYIRFASASFNTTESSGSTTITVERVGETSQAVTVDYATSDDNASLAVVLCPTVSGIASSRCDFTTALGTLRFAAGENSKTFVVLISQDNYVEGPEVLPLTLSNLTGGALFATPSSATLTITDDATEPATNPIDLADSFVRQHYHDFLNREPDAAGLAFWTNQITECEQPGATCNAEVRRINVSAAFFLSIEFQETGYLVERLYKSAYRDADGTSTIGGTHQLPVPIIRFTEFLPDTQEIGRGFVVGQPGADLVLENNKQAFIAGFVQRSRFTNAYPTTRTPDQFVDALFTNTGVTPSASEHMAAIGEFAGAATSADNSARARALRLVAENGTFAQQEGNRAFVLMQYFGYMRRNPNNAPDSDYTGYDFWLGKLNQFNGNFVNAEMVKAFIISGEYRQRFGQ